MIEKYLNLLKKGGLILTDKKGLAYHEGSGFGLNFDDLLKLGKKFKVEVYKYTDYVYSIKKI